GTVYGDTVRRELLTDYRVSAVPGAEQPLITKPVESRDLAWTAYQKPALMLTILRDAVLGRDAFERALREYVRRWSFRHPQPADFFRTIENVSGTDLDWFWRGWVYTTARLEQRARDTPPRSGRPRSHRDGGGGIRGRGRWVPGAEPGGAAAARGPHDPAGRARPVARPPGSGG